MSQYIIEASVNVWAPIRVTVEAENVEEAKKTFADLMFDGCLGEKTLESVTVVSYSPIFEWSEEHPVWSDELIMWPVDREDYRIIRIKEDAEESFKGSFGGLVQESRSATIRSAAIISDCGSRRAD